MHQSFTEPVTHAQDIDNRGLIGATLDALQNALDEAQKRYNGFRKQKLNEAQYDFYCKVGLDYAVRFPSEWRKFYRNNVGETCDYEKLNNLFYKFYKIQNKKLAKNQ